MMRAVGRRALSGAGALRVRSAVGGSAARALHGSTPLRREEEPLPPSIIEKYQLDEPTRFVPLTIAGFGLGSLTGLYHFDGESQLLALWVLFCGTVYSRGGPIIAEMLDDISDQIQKEQSALEDANINAIKATLDAHKSQANLFETINSLYEAQAAVIKEAGEVVPQRLQHSARDAVVSKLDALVTLEQNVKTEITGKLVAKATSSVKEAYTSGADSGKLKTAALDAAFAALSSPEGAKKDATVGKLYQNFFSSFRAEQEAKKGSTVELTAEQKTAIKDAAESLALREGVDPSIIEVPSKVVL